jgi:hypothetical protein
VIWGLPELALYCCAPQLAHQAFAGPSTIGAVVGGPEATRLPNVVVDAYTGVTLAWAFNEPVIKLPLLGTVLTVSERAILLPTREHLRAGHVFFKHKKMCFPPFFSRLLVSSQDKCLFLCVLSV